ncbi:MAG TPA: HAD family hydrolase [Bacillota bacterium]|nr:HAD family hydrolase [Bacillota bacterium]
MAWKYILFDLDGTLTDSGPGIIRSVSYALAAFGIEVPTEQSLRAFIGPPLYASFMKHYGFDEAKAALAVEKYREYFAVKGMYENSLYEGIAELLQELREGGSTLAVATSKPTVFAEQIARHFGIDAYFDVIVGSELDGSRIEKSEVVAHTLMQLDVKNPADALMVGDREHDILGARANGLESIGVLYGYGSREELTAAQAPAIVATVQELKDLLLPVYAAEPADYKPDGGMSK